MRIKASLVAVTLLLLCGLVRAQEELPPERLDVPYEPTPPPVVAAMLSLAKVGPGDVLYDLGCGDGRFVVAAAKLGARGVGIDLDPQRLAEAKENAEAAKVTDRVRFAKGDFFEADFHEATVVAIYLLDEVNLEMRPRMFRQLRPGSRIVSHAFHMSDWEPDATQQQPRARNNTIYLWIIPAGAGGRWTWTSEAGSNPAKFSLSVDQEFQIATARLAAEGSPEIKASRVQLKGKEMTIEAEVPVAGAPAKVQYTGTIEGDRITGTQTWESGPLAGTREWMAQREPVDPVGTWQVSINPPRPSIRLSQLLIRKDPMGGLVAGAGGGSVPKRVGHYYQWGASLRLDLPLSAEASAVFRGMVEGDKMSGTITLPDSSEVEWTAVRASQEPGTAAAPQGGG